MILGYFKKLINFRKKDDKSPKVGKIEEGFNYLNDKAQELVSESKVIVGKLQNLHETNYQLGLDQLAKGNLKEAIFRFKIVRKFWPTNYDAHLKLIYCYHANNDNVRANRAEEILLELDNSLKSQIDQARNDASLYKTSAKSPIIVSDSIASDAPNLVNDDNISNNKTNL